MLAIFYIKVQLKLSCFKKAFAIQSSNKQMNKQLTSIAKTNERVDLKLFLKTDIGHIALITRYC